jgi:hypothetical protein
MVLNQRASESLLKISRRDLEYYDFFVSVVEIEKNSSWFLQVYRLLDLLPHEAMLEGFHPTAPNIP